MDYYVSYFDYYQPEAYIASSDTYIEKDSAINDELDRLSLNAMNSLMTRRDVIVVASVSCIYGLSTPEDYRNLTLRIREGDIMDRDVFLRQLVERLFERQDFDFTCGTFRVRGEVVEVFPAYSEGEAIRVEFFGDEVERVSLTDSTSGRVRERLGSYTFSRPSSTWPLRKNGPRRLRPSERSWRTAWDGLRSMGVFWKRSA